MGTIKSMPSLFANETVGEIPFVEQVISCGPEEKVINVIEMLRAENIGSIVILDPQKKVLGIFTERDYIMKIAGKEPEYLNLPIKNFMTMKPKSILSNENAFKALMIMRIGQFRHIIVTDEKENLCGILSSKDILDYIYDKTNKLIS